MGLFDGLPKLKKKKAPVKSDPGGVVATREVNKLRDAFIARSNLENERYTQAVDSEYWFAVCFQSRAQKEAFLKALGLEVYGDKYIDGARIAHKFSVTLPPALKSKPQKKPDAAAVALVKDF